MNTLRIGIVALGLVLLVAGALSFARTANDDTTCTRQLISSGVTRASAGTVRLAASLGQPVVGDVASSDGQITLVSGFRQDGRAAYTVYLPLTVKSGA